MDESRDILRAVSSYKAALMLSRSCLGRDGITPPIPAPEDDLIFTPVDGFEKPLSLEEISTFFGRSAPHSLSKLYDVAPGIPHSGPIKMSDFEGKGCRYRIQGKAYFDRWDDLKHMSGLFPNPDYGWDTDGSLNIGAPYGGYDFPKAPAAWSNSFVQAFAFVYWAQGEGAHVISVDKYSVRAITSHSRSAGDPDRSEMTYKPLTFVDFDNNSISFGKGFTSRSQYSDGRRHEHEVRKDYVINGEVTDEWSDSPTQGERMREVKEHIGGGFMFMHAGKRAGTESPFVNYLEVEIDCVIDLCEITSTIDKPRITYPYDGEKDVSPRPVVECTEFSGDGSHYSTDWEVYSDPTLTRELTVIEDNLNDQVNKTSFRVEQILEGEFIYYVRCRHRNERGEESPWSDVVGFEVEKQKGTSWTYHGVSDNLKGVYLTPYYTGTDGEFYLKNAVSNQNTISYITNDNVNWTRQRQVNTSFGQDNPQNVGATDQQFSDNRVIDVSITGSSSTRVLLSNPSTSVVEDITSNLQYGGQGFNFPPSVDVNDVVWLGPKKDGDVSKDKTCQYSTDYGQTWNTFTLSNPSLAKPPAPSAVLLNNQNVIFYIYSGGNQTSGFGFYHYSLDNGNTWVRSEAWKDLGAVAARDTEYVVSNNKALLTYTNINDSRRRTGVYIFRSTDAVNWTDIKSVIQAEKLATFTNTTSWKIFVDSNGQFVYADDQGDFLLSKDNGVTWQREEALYDAGWNAGTSIDAFIDKGGKYYIHNSTTGEWATSP